MLKHPTEVRAAILKVAVGLGMTCPTDSAATALETKRKHDAATAAACDIETMMKVYVYVVGVLCLSIELTVIVRD